MTHFLFHIPKENIILRIYYLSLKSNFKLEVNYEFVAYQYS